MFTESLLMLLGFRASDPTPAVDLEKTEIVQFPQVTAYAKFKGTPSSKGFNGVATFFQQPNGTTVVYGQWNGFRHDVNPAHYEFVVRKEGLAQRDLTTNIRRDIDIDRDAAFLLTSFESLPLSGSNTVIGGDLYIYKNGHVIARAEIYRI